MKIKPAKHLPRQGKWVILGLVLISVIYLLGRSIHQSFPPHSKKVHPVKRHIPPSPEWSRPPLISPEPIITGPKKKAQASIVVDGFPQRSSPPLPSPKRIVTRPKKKAQVSIIVDDLGNQYSPVRELIWIDFPLTMAVLPFGPFTKRIAEEVLASGKDMILHLPMEPWGYPQKDPGKEALFVSMTPEEVLFQLKKAIQALAAININAKHLEQDGSDFVVSDQLGGWNHNEALDALYDAKCGDFEFETYSRIELY